MPYHIVSSEVVKPDMVSDDSNVTVQTRIFASMDSAADLNALGTGFAPFSIAHVAGGANYELSPSGVWKEM